MRLSRTPIRRPAHLPISLFSQSLFALPLMDAIDTTARLGIPAIELACTAPHFDRPAARSDPMRVASRIREQGLAVSALSLFSTFTDPVALDDQLDTAETYIRLAPAFETAVVKITPGPPASAEATDAHWACLGRALDRLIPLAADLGVRLACETHMRQLTDTVAGIQRLLKMTASETLGLTVDFSNMTFAGERMPYVFATLGRRMYNTHIKNGTVGDDGAWRFHALDTGWTDYVEVLSMLRARGYAGYLTLECLGPEAKTKPEETVKRDFELLKGYMERTGW